MMLTEYQSLEFIIDDSGSMQCLSDTVNPLTRQPQTRWQEAQVRLKEMIEISVGHGAFIAEVEPLIKKLPFRIFTFEYVGEKTPEMS